MRPHGAPDDKVDRDHPSFVTVKRARQARQEAEQREIVGAPVSVTGCAREGCDGKLGTRCYLPASRCLAVPD